MNLFTVDTRFVPASRNRRRMLAHSLAVLFASSSLFVTFGCASDNAKEVGASTPAAGQTAGAASKPTAEQEAANQRAIDQGPAIHAANEAAVKGNTSP